MKIKFSSRFWKIQNAALIVLLLFSLLTLTKGNVLAYDEAPPGPNVLQGGVTKSDGSGSALGARVLAWQGAIRFSQVVDGSGNYSLNLPAGSWLVTVLPPAVTTTSPDWIFIGDPVLVSFGGIPETKTQDFTVEPATAALSGRLLVPAGGTDFLAPNRAWVRAENTEGQGNNVQVNSDGTFVVKILPGNIHLRLTFENPAWAPPLTLAGSEWYIPAGGAQNIGDQQLLERKATTSGQVTHSPDNAPVVNIPVRAWRVDGSENAVTRTDAGGNFTLHVIQGVWEVQVIPDNPLLDYIPAQRAQKVLLPNEDSSATQNLQVLTADVTVNGVLVNALGVPVPGLRGRVFATYKDGTRWPMYTGSSAVVVGGLFSLKLSSQIAAQYRLYVYLAPETGYTAIGHVQIAVNPGDIQNIQVPVAQNNSTISGYFLNHDTGLPWTGHPGAVYAASNSGAVDRDRLNPVDGSYQMDVATTDTAGHGGSLWWLRAFVDPTTGWFVAPPRFQKVFIPFNNGNGANVTADFVVARASGTIRGQVTDPLGNPIAGARVSVMEQNSPAGYALNRWSLTGQDGRYLIRVTPGFYKVRADFHNQNWVSPVPVAIAVPPETVRVVNLQFRPRNASISGLVTYNGLPHAAFIRAFSNTGAHASGQAGADGLYTVSATGGDVWHVQAVSEDGTTFLVSERVVVNTVVGANPGVDLVLQVSDTLPERLALTFEAAYDQVLTLSNGAQIIIPAYALADSGLVTVLVKPVVELADDGGAKPVAFGYRLLAFTEDGTPITNFNARVTLSMPFTAAQLTSLGVTADQLIPTYWDVGTSSWKPVENFALEMNPDGSGDGSLLVTVAHFTDFAAMGYEPQFQVFLPAVMK